MLANHLCLHLWTFIKYVSGFSSKPKGLCAFLYLFFHNLLKSLLFMNHLANLEHVVQTVDTNKSWSASLCSSINKIISIPQLMLSVLAESSGICSPWPSIFRFLSQHLSSLSPLLSPNISSKCPSPLPFIFSGVLIFYVQRMCVKYIECLYV